MCCNILIEKLNANTDCFSHSNAAAENGQRFQLVLPKGEIACRVQIDGCLIKEKHGEKKCDYLFYHCEADEYFFVELKGSDLQQAFLQLKSTIITLKPQLKFDKNQCNAFISASKVSPSFRTKRQKFEEEFRKYYVKVIRISSSSPEWVIK